MLSREGMLFRKELRELLRARALWVLWIVLSLLVGYSFIQAVGLYAEASRTAISSPGMARGLSPLDGVLVPTFGAYYVALTFLFPFLAIRLIGNEKQSGSVKFLLQLPARPSLVVGVKALALLLAGLLLALPGFSVVGIWISLGGHLHAPEVLNLVLGYGLYALAVAGIAFFSSAVTESLSTAAVVALALILGSWVLDFAGGTAGGWSALSLTASLRVFERGLFSWPHAWRFICVGTVFMGSAALWLPAAPMVRKILRVGLFAVAAAALGVVGGRARIYADVSEELRNSFNPAEERFLRGLGEPLTLTVHLSPEDSRFKDMDRNIFDKLRRLVPRLRIIVPEEKAGPLGASGGEDYGWIAYEYAGKQRRSTSNSDEEVFSILHELAGQTVTPDPEKDYPGYPLVADARPWAFWFYGVLPALGLLGAWGSRRISI